MYFNVLFISTRVYIPSPWTQGYLKPPLANKKWIDTIFVSSKNYVNLYFSTPNTRKLCSINFYWKKCDLVVYPLLYLYILPQPNFWPGSWMPPTLISDIEIVGAEQLPTWLEMEMNASNKSCPVNAHGQTRASRQFQSKCKSNILHFNSTFFLIS